MLKRLRLPLVLAVASMAAASHAIVFGFVGQTPSGITSSTTSFTTTSVLNWSNSPYSLITSGLVTFNGTNNSVVFTTGSSSTPGTLTLSFDGTANTNTSAGTSSTTSMATVTGATGVFAGTTGTLTVTSNSNFVAGTNAFTAVGNVTPEPASLAALGLGTVALLRRRRRS